MVRIIVWVLVVVAMVKTVDYLWLDHRLMEQLPLQAWLDRFSQGVERFGRSLIGTNP
jgi:hypothetical protein